MEKIKNKLERARRYEAAALQQQPKLQRPQFHLSAPVGWINDPNGFSTYQGETHLFFQYHPYSIEWGPMHWGHVKTKDFVKWEYLPTALAPDQEYDGFGCFSGTAMEYDGKHLLAYTGVEEITKGDGTKIVQQCQCMAWGDGINYEKMSMNPVICADTLPAGSSNCDFRDPKIWKEDNWFYLLVGSRGEDGSGQFALFRAKEITQWEFVSIVDRCNNVYGKMWECPDYFALDQEEIILLSPQEMIASGMEFHPGNNTMALVGHMDKKSHLFQRNSVQVIDQGLDFYAPQTMRTKDGRRVMIGWMHTWETKLYPADADWCGMMSFPRVLEVKEGHLYQQPVEEIKEYYGECISLRGEEIRGTKEFSGIKGRIFDLTVEVIAGEYTDFAIQLAKDASMQTSLTYQADRQELVFDRTASGLRQDTLTTRKIKVKKKGGRENNTITFRILADRYSIEIFVNNGESVMSNLIFTPMEAEQIHFVVNGWAKVNIEKHNIVM